MSKDTNQEAKIVIKEQPYRQLGKYIDEWNNILTNEQKSGWTKIETKNQIYRWWNNWRANISKYEWQTIEFHQ